MPDEYISREAALRAVQKQRGANRSPAQNAMLDRICCDIKNMTAADVAEVHNARWEEADWREYDAQSDETICFPKAAIVCSDCRNAFKKGSLRVQSFCPACGAKMDGGEDCYGNDSCN